MEIIFVFAKYFSKICNMVIVQKSWSKSSLETHYAVVDIETTGGSVSNSRITEIAIMIHDGEKVISRWHSLVNPEMDIPMHITALTGINEEMVTKAPTFTELASEVYELLRAKVFVAHNVNFDYSFLRGQLAASGLQWDAPKLCTVRLSRKLFPGLPSYSLGKICAQLGITLVDRHRATGDATATAQLFSMLLERDNEGMILGMLRKVSPEQRLPPNVPIAHFQALPESTGVYYFHDHKGKVIYVGKALNLKKRVASHFSGNTGSSRRQSFLREIYGISFEPCGSELMALLFECAEIQRLWPLHNRALKRFEPQYGLYHYVAVSGYSHLAVGRLPKQQQCLKAFDKETDGVNFLVEKSNQFEIDPRFCRYGRSSPFRTAEPLPPIDQHNRSVDNLLEGIGNQQSSFIIALKGRHQDERGYVYVEKGMFYGMGYLDHHLVPDDAEMLKDSIKRYKGNHYMLQLVMSFAERFPSAVKWLNEHNFQAHL
jgi:DNA polymerase III subunit epsilon